MLRYHFILSIIFLFLIGNINGQELVITNSGQKLLVKKDGSWDVLARDAALAVDGSITTQTTTDANVFEIPEEKTEKLTTAQTTVIDGIVKVLEGKEAEVAVSMYQGEKYISKLKERLSAPTKEDKKRLNSLIKEQEKVNEKNDDYYSTVSDFINSFDKLTDMEPSDVDKKLGYLKAKVEKEYTLDLPTSSNVAAQAEFAKKTNYSTSFDISKSKYPKDPFDCNITFEGKDPITGKKKKETSSATLFTFTQEKLKSYFKQDDFLSCESLVTKVGKNYYVTLNFRIKSKDASKTYGSLKAQEEIRVEFIDGNKIYGTNIIQSTGEIEPYSGNTIFSGVYQFDKDEFDKLGRKLIDNIGVLWSSGFEQYEVYNVDLLINQITCLKKG